MIRASGWMPLAILGTVAGLTWWLARLVAELPDANAPPASAQADGIIDDFVARSLDENGRVRQVLKARQMTHYPKTQTSTLVQVQLESFAPEQPRILVTADNGTVDEDGDRVTLTRNVRVLRDAGPDNEALTVRTDTLVARPETGTLTTRSPVFAESASMKARSEGMDYNHETKRFKLYRVSATLTPAKK
jgi:lipopolysaccharide export system protein LptC